MQLGLIYAEFHQRSLLELSADHYTEKGFPYFFKKKMKNSENIYIPSNDEKFLRISLWIMLKKGVFDGYFCGKHHKMRVRCVLAKVQSAFISYFANTLTKAKIALELRFLISESKNEQICYRDLGYPVSDIIPFRFQSPCCWGNQKQNKVKKNFKIF